MAITPIAERDAKYGIAWGNHASVPDFTTTTWTSLASAGLPVESHILFNKNPGIRRPVRANAQRQDYYVDAVNDALGSMPTFTYNAPATYATLDLFLGSAFQKVTEATGTPFVKDFVHPAVNAFPDFSTSAGSYFTLIKDTGVAATADYVMMSSVIQRLSLSCSATANDGRLTVSADCCARYTSSGTYAGTLTLPTSYNYWNFADLTTFSLGGTAIVPYGFTLTFETGLRPIPTGGSTTRGTQTYVAAYQKTTGSVELLWDSVARSYIGVESQASLGQLVIAWGTGLDPITTTGDLLLKANIQPTSHSFAGTDEVKATINFDCIRGLATEPFEAHVANAIDRGAVWAAHFWG